jgi:Kef-type K+ transport system membrane component KefB
LITYLIRADGKHRSRLFILSLILIDLCIDSLLLTLHVLSAGGNPLTWKFCVTLIISEAWAFASVIYLLVPMIWTRLYNLKWAEQMVRRRYLMLVLIIAWICLFHFYGIPFLSRRDEYLSPIIKQTAY